MKYLKRETVAEKAYRLKSNHRVILLEPDSAIVIGDHDTYGVNRLGSCWFCSCPWGRKEETYKHCSHVLATKLARKDPASQEPVARLADLLMKKRGKGVG